MSGGKIPGGNVRGRGFPGGDVNLFHYLFTYRKLILVSDFLRAPNFRRSCWMQVDESIWYLKYQITHVYSAFVKYPDTKIYVFLFV